MPQKHDIGTQKRIRRTAAKGDHSKTQTPYHLALNLVQRGLATKEILSDRPAATTRRSNNR